MKTATKYTLTRLTIKIFLLTLLFYSNNIFGQDPGVNVIIKLFLNGKQIDANYPNGFEVFMNIENRSKQIMEKGGYFYRPYPNDELFWWTNHYSPYCKEIYELMITNKVDTMNIRFKKDWKGISSQDTCIMITDFYFEIPFKSGYYEVTDFISRIGENWGGYALPENFTWTHLAMHDRKLLVGGQ